MEDLHLLYALAGLLAVALILASRRLSDLPVTEPMAGMLAGLAIGGADADLLTIPGDHRAAILLEGSRVPVGGWVDLGWGALGFAVGVLLLRRPPAVLLLGSPAGLAMRDRAFAGWFGPIGVSAVFYLAHAEDEGVVDERLFAAGTLAVATSTFAHGVTQIAGRRLYARRNGDR